MAVRDYFSFETIRDHEKNVICYYITMIGTIEGDGIVHMRTDLGKDNNEKMAFGRVTLHNLDRKIGLLLKETGSRVYYHYHDELNGSTDVVSFTAKDWRADEAYEFEEGDRVLVQGRAYLRKADPERFPVAQAVGDFAAVNVQEKAAEHPIQQEKNVGLRFAAAGQHDAFGNVGNDEAAGRTTEERRNQIINLRQHQPPIGFLITGEIKFV